MSDVNNCRDKITLLVTSNFFSLANNWLIVPHPSQGPT